MPTNSRRSYPADLYRVYDASGDLLYVGIAVNVFNRMRGHRREAAWWPLADTGTVERYPKRFDAQRAESRAIRSEHPKFNVRNERSYGDMPLPEPIERMSLFWEEGQVWVDAAN
jgi:hypothetical protein